MENTFFELNLQLMFLASSTYEDCSRVASLDFKVCQNN